MTSMNVVGWFDIYVHDMERAVTFYEAILEYNLEPITDPTGQTEMMSFPADMTVYGAAGALVKSVHTRPGSGGTQIYFSVEDCAIVEDLVGKAGGQVVRSKFSIGEFGFVTLCQDTEGNLFGLHSMQ